MHEKFDEEMERQSRKLDERIFQSPTISSLADIRRVLMDLDPARAMKSSMPIAGEMIADDENGQRRTYRVTATADATDKRSIVLQGFEFIKGRTEFETKSRELDPVMVNGREMRPAIRPTIEARAWVDPLLDRWFGATREGLFIVWVVKEGKFLYDPFIHKLFKAKTA